MSALPRLQARVNSTTLRTFIVRIEKPRDVLVAEGVDADLAPLFEAAPDLLAALRNLVEAQRSGLLVLSPAGAGHDYLTQALDAIERAGSEPLQPVTRPRASIAKARGK